MELLEWVNVQHLPGDHGTLLFVNNDDEHTSHHHGRSTEDQDEEEPFWWANNYSNDPFANDPSNNGVLSQGQSSQAIATTTTTSTLFSSTATSSRRRERGLVETMEEQKKPKDTNETIQYYPPSYVVDMHLAPRFGHSNRIGRLASSNPEEQQDYAHGIKDFTLLIVIPFFLWGVALLSLKFCYGTERVGCAAGGDILDMKALSRDGVSRKQRRRRILRSWRTQVAFLIIGVLLPTFTLLMMELGWKNLDSAWKEVQGVVDDVEALAFRGWNVVEALQDTKTDLYDNRLVKELLKSSDQKPFQSWCPQGGNAIQLLYESMETIQSSTQDMVHAFDTYVPQSTQAFETMVGVTQGIDESIDWFFEKDWILKMILMLLNVINLLFLLACCTFSRNNIIHPPSRMFLSLILVPAFTILTLFLLLVTATSGTATLLNADFCAGGPDPGSPQGTLEDAILSFQYGSLEPGQTITGTLGVVHESFTYYADGCLAEHSPVEFLTHFSNEADRAMAYLNDVVIRIPNTTASVAALSDECGSDLSFLPTTLLELQTHVKAIQGSMHSLVDMAACHSISPLIRRIAFGSLCKESAYGLTWIWSCCLVLCILCFGMLTTRAALFNPIIAKKKREKQPKCKVEKEFEEYKEFMKDRFDDTEEWVVKPPKKNRKDQMVEFEFDPDFMLEAKPTFDTDPTTKPSGGELDQLSEGGGFHDLEAENDDDDNHDESSSEPDVSYGSSYESSSEEGSNDEISLDDESAIMSFVVETRSMLAETKSVVSSMTHRTFNKLNNTLGPLLGSRQPNNNNQDEAASDEEEDSLFFSSPSFKRGTGDGEGDGLWSRMMTPTNLNQMYLFGTSRILSVRTPNAPKKTTASLARTDAVSLETEMEPLTGASPPPNKTNAETPSSQDHGWSSSVKPRQLQLSPCLPPARVQLDFPPKRGQRQRKVTQDNLSTGSMEEEVPTLRFPNRNHPHREQIQGSTKRLFHSSQTSEGNRDRQSGARRATPKLEVTKLPSQPKKVSPRGLVESTDSDELKIYHDRAKQGRKAGPLEPPEPPSKSRKQLGRTRASRGPYYGDDDGD